MVSFLFTNIHSHSTATLSFNIIHKFTFNDSSQLRIYLFTVATYLHSHSRSKFLFNTVAIFLQQFVNVLKFTNSMFLHTERFNSFSRIHSFTFKGQKFYSTLLLYLFNILCASLFTHSQAPACTIFWKQNRRPTMVIWSAPVRRCLREEI